MGRSLPARRGLFYVSLLDPDSTVVPKHKLMGLAFEKSFRVDGSHAPGPSGSHRLPIDVILYIATSENPHYVGLGTVVRHDVTRRI